jgi:hypothetical protein
VTTLRLVYSAAYVVAGVVIVVRLAAYGLRLETAGGLILGVAIAGLGTYRLVAAMRHVRAAK